MKSLSRFVAAAALFALPALPAYAQEVKQTPGSRITVSQCYPHRHTVSGAHPWIDPYGNYHGPLNFPYYEGFLAVTYVNNAARPAKEIDFGLVARGSLIAITKDAGTFSSGAKIEHEFSVDPSIFPVGTMYPYCAVLRVQYADGSVWRNPNPPVP